MGSERPYYDHLWVTKPCVIAVYLALSLAAFLCAGAMLWWNYDPFRCCAQLSTERLATMKLLSYAFCFGGVGATCYSIYGLYLHVAADDYDHSYLYWYLFRGPLGAVLGLVSYLLLLAGLLTIADVNASQAIQAPPSLKSKAAISAIAFLAGFCTNQFIEKLKACGRTLFGTGTHKDKEAFQKKLKAGA